MAAAAHYIEIDASARQCYDWWRPLTHLPQVLPDVERVEPKDGSADTTEWTVKGPLGRLLRWDAQIVEDVPGHKIAWSTVDSTDPDVKNSGVVRFDDKGSTTGFEISLDFTPPGGKVGEVATTLFDNPQEKVKAAAESFKRLMEQR